MSISMKFYLYSPEGDCDSFAWKLQEEGHDVRLFIKEDWMRANLRGMVPHTQTDPVPGEIIILGSTKHGAQADKWRAAGFATLGGAAVADRMELDRWWFLQQCGLLGINTPECRHYTSY